MSLALLLKRKFQHVGHKWVTCGSHPDCSMGQWVKCVTHFQPWWVSYRYTNLTQDRPNVGLQMTQILDCLLRSSQGKLWFNECAFSQTQSQFFQFRYEVLHTIKDSYIYLLINA